MKIVHVVHSLGTGGLENGLVNILSRLDSNFEHTVCCLTTAGKFAGRIENRHVEIIELDLSANGFRFPLVRLARMFRELSPDIIHTRGWPTVDAVFAAQLTQNCRIIHGEHGREYSDVKGLNWKRNQVRRIIGHLVDRYVIVSDFFRSWLNQSCGVKNDRIIYIPNGVDTAKFSPLGVLSGNGLLNGDATTARRILRTQLGLPAEAPLLGTIGRLDPVKDIPTLFRGFKKAKHKFPDAKLAIVGNGPIRTGLESLAEELELSSNLIWLGERDDTAELLRCFDLFVQTSIFEGMSNTILEAMASGLPIVTTNTGGNPELVKSGENGTLIEVGDVDGLGRALEEYLNDQTLRKNHGSGSRDKAVNHFDLSLMTQRYAAMYEALA